MTQFRGVDPINDDNWLVAKVKKNPEAFLVLAAGCALLLRSGGTPSQEPLRYRNGSWNDESYLSRTAAAARGYASDMKGRVKDAAAAVSDKAGDYAASLSDTTSAVSEKVAGYATSLSDQAADWSRSVSEQTSRMGVQARSSIEEGVGRMLKEKPLAVAALGLAAGAAVAALLRPTEVEQQALRPFREAVGDAVATAKENVRDAVAATSEQVKEGAERRGFSAEGIKGMAREAAETFTDKLTGKSADGAQMSSPGKGD
jgi:hypothetical protein